MVDPFQLANDIVGFTVSLLLPGLLWLLLFLLAWEHGPFAESIGFGRKVFWLLLPGALLATFADLPITPVSYDWLGVSLAGALFPLLVGLLAFGRVAPPRSRSLTLVLLLVAVEAGLLFLLVLPPAASLSKAMGSALGTSEYIGNDLVVTAAAAAFSAVVGAMALATSDAVARRVAFLVALASGGIVAAFVASFAVPGVGIVEEFPIYLLGPIAIGLVAVLAAGRVFPGEEAFAIPTAFLAGAFGPLIGADVLREPPLYGTGPAGVAVVGGAGVLDLVYLSPLLAFATAYLLHRADRRGYHPVGTPLPTPSPSPINRLLRAFQAGVEGRLSESLHGSSEASRVAADQTRRLLELPPAPADRPWQGLPVPGWVVADQANLEASARAGTDDGREAFRSWRTARWLVRIGHEIADRRFAPWKTRAAAFLLDLVLVTVPAILVWVLLLGGIQGSSSDALSNVGYQVATFGYIAVAFLYFVLAETFWGTTVGKRCFGLEVRDRDLRPPSGLSSLVRNSTTLPILTLLGFGLTIALAFDMKTVGSSSVLGGVGVPAGWIALLGIVLFVLAGVAILGGVAVLFIGLTAERQRLGDLWAQTWVVRRRPPTFTMDGVPPGATATPSSPEVGPSG